MNRQIRLTAFWVACSMLTAAPPVFAQSKGNDKPPKQAEDKAGKQDRGRSDKAGKASDRAQQGKAGKADKSEKGDHARGRAAHKAEKPGRAPGGFSRSIELREMHPRVRGLAASSHARERVAAGAVARAIARGVGEDEIRISRNGDRVRVTNRSGVTLLDLDEDRARNLGAWRVRPQTRELRGDAPSFCRSGDGHPVWGRQWCIDKGFGLAGYQNLRWGYTQDVDDIQLRRVDAGTVASAVLRDVLGDVVFNRLGLHALTLGYTDPLTGAWIGEPAGPQVLRITSGGMPIAEIVDADRDNRADALVVALRPW